MVVIVPAISFCATFLLLALFLKSQVLARIADIPNERSLHVQPVPRIGGIAMVCGVTVATLLLPGWPSWAVIASAALLVAVSLIDDIRGMAVHWRLLAHGVAAVVFVTWGMPQPLPAIGAVTLALLTIWMTNLYNFMDGSDGLAGGMATIGFSAYGAGAWVAGAEGFALLNFSVATAALAFLRYNFSPAKVFMGDTGSIPLGFLAASCGALGWQRDIWPVWFPFLVFSPFLVDASVTLVRRLLRGERVWRAHKEHYYQRLVQAGWGHRRTALMEYILMIGVALSALYGARQPIPGQLVILAVWAVIFLILCLSLEWHWRSATARKS